MLTPPPPLTPIFDNIPSELTQRRQWVNWRLTPRKEDKKPTKPPFMPSGKLAKIDDPATWSHCLTTQAAYKEPANKLDGVGFVLTKVDPYVAFDFDDCYCKALLKIDPSLSHLDAVLPAIAAHIRSLNSYTEESPSGKGIRVFTKGALPEDGKKKGPIEVYQNGRYVTLTGHHITGSPRTIEPRQEAIDAFYKAVFGTTEEPPKQEKPRQDDSPFDWNHLREKAFQSVNGPEIQRLWSGDFSAYESQSEGDLALCCHLAFWLAGDAKAMDAAFRQSGLFRKKWDEKHGSSTYGEATIRKAVEGCTEHYEGKSQSQEERESTPPGEWPDPVPFNDYSSLPSFPVEALPGVCGEMVREVAKSCQVDAGLAGGMALAVLSTAIGAQTRVVLNSHSEQGNLYVLAALGSGNRKSETTNQLAAPIYIYQKARQEVMIPIIREAETLKRIREKRLEKLEKLAANEDDSVKRDTLQRDCADVQREITENPLPTSPKYLVDNITLEKLGGIMAANHGRVAILSPEGGFFKPLSGQYSKGSTNIDLVLKAHTGDPWSEDRIMRDSQQMEHPALTIGLAVQPDVLEEIGKNSEFRERGLSARFMYVWCQSNAGYRILQTSPVAASVRDGYHRLILSLMAVDGKHELTLTPEAQELWSGFSADVELLLRPGATLNHLIDWGSKLAGAVARLSGLLHFAEHGPDAIGKPISFDSMSHACILGGYFTEHAVASFGKMKADIRLTVAQKILDYLKRCKPQTFKGVDLFDHTSCASMDDILPGLSILIERGYIREVGKVDSRKPGRPASQVYAVNPKIS